MVAKIFSASQEILLRKRLGQSHTHNMKAQPDTKRKTHQEQNYIDRHLETTQKKTKNASNYIC